MLTEKTREELEKELEMQVEYLTTEGNIIGSEVFETPVAKQPINGILSEVEMPDKITDMEELKKELNMLAALEGSSGSLSSFEEEGSFEEEDEFEDDEDFDDDDDDFSEDDFDDDDDFEFEDEDEDEEGSFDEEEEVF